MDSTNNGFSPADLAAVTNGNNWGENGWWLIIFFLILCGGNGFGWGNNNNSVLDSTLAASAAQGGYVTSNQLNDALRLQSIQQGQRDITDAVTSSEQRLTANQTSVISELASLQQAQQSCCANINYNSAINTASINQNVTAQVQKVLDSIQQDKIESLQQQVNQLQFQNALGNVVRYPTTTAYTSGANPFCNCNCTNL